MLDATELFGMELNEVFFNFLCCGWKAFLDALMFFLFIESLEMLGKDCMVRKI